MFESSKWIWINSDNNPDEYAEFSVSFSLNKIEKICLNISVDGNFEAYLNGRLCAIGACSDYPHEKYYDSFDLDEFAVLGENRLKITVWHIGVGSSVYVSAAPGVIFSVTQGEDTVAVSDGRVLSRKNVNYTNGLCKLITGQLGPSYRYDNSLESGEDYLPSAVVYKTDNIKKREIDNLLLLDRADITVKEQEDSILIDFGRETVGYLDLDFVSEVKQELLIVFGEHLDGEGRVPRIIGQRDFSIGFVAREGENRFFGGMRRIAGRYLEIFSAQPIKINYFGVRAVAYPLREIEKSFEKELHKRIYDTCVYTLRCCMHEHYEDCPWREQALYALDSRNQMLCGYIAFEEYRYPRFNIVLLARSLTDGLLKITSPTDTSLPIPFFSLAFIQQVYEYIHFSADVGILDDVGDTLDAIMENFASRIDDCGLIPIFPAPAWNFYEWSEGNSGNGIADPGITRYDLCLNAMFIYVYKMYTEMRGEMKVDIDCMRRALRKVFYNEEKGFFKNSTTDSGFSVLGNSLAILAGVGERALAERLIYERGELTDNTLSMNGYFYDALLLVDKGYKDYILKDIEDKYSYMLDCGATTFWETIEGWHAFSDAGSLCHGWSALPIYYLNLLV